MANFSYQGLATELAGDSYAAKSRAERLAVLNGPSAGGESLAGPLPTGPLLIWGAMTGVRARIEAGVSNVDPIVASACLATRDAFAGAVPLDLTSPYIVGAGGLLDRLASAGVLNASGPGSKADLIAAGSRPLSRAEVLWADRLAVPITDDDMARAGS